MSVQGVRQLRTYLVMALIIGMGALWWMSSYFTKQRAKQAQQASEQPLRPDAVPLGGPEAERILQIDDLRHRDPEGTLKLVEAVLAAPRSVAEKNAARDRHAGVMSDVFNWRLKNQRLDEATALRRRAEELYPDAEAVRGIARNWQGHQRKQFDEALRAGDWTAVETAALALFAEPREEWHAQVFENWQRRKLQLWREAVQSKVAGTDSMLTDALLVIASPNPAGNGESELRQSMTGQELAARGDALVREDERRHAAVFYWQAALAEAPTARGWLGDAKSRNVREDPKRVQERKQTLTAKIAQGWLELGERLARGDKPAFVLITPAEAYRIAGHHADPKQKARAYALTLAEETAALQREAEALLRRAREATASGVAPRNDRSLESRLAEIRNRASTIMARSGSDLWVARVNEPGYDAWAALPPDLRKTLDARVRSQGYVPSARGQFLAGAFRSNPERLPLKELDPLRDLHASLETTIALLGLDHNLEHSFTKLRPVLRTAAPGSPRRVEIEVALRARLKARASEKHFERVYELSGFYVAELGAPSAADPFRAELRALLEATATNFKGAESMKHIFMLTLIGECFPTEVFGKQTRDDAFEKAFEAVAGVPVETDRSALEPSGEPSLSFHLIDNSTSHHLLMFYRGPERVAVACWPYRRGTVALRNGEYELVVLSPEKSIRPYHGKVAMESAARTSNYVVQTSGRGGDFESAAGGASGDYHLLRAPPGETNLMVDPETGTTTRRK